MLLWLKSLLFPAAGSKRGLVAILQHAKLVKSPLERAARAGALCMAVRVAGWKPVDGDRIEQALVRGPLVKHKGKKWLLQPVLEPDVEAAPPHQTEAVGSFSS